MNQTSVAPAGQPVVILSRPQPSLLGQLGHHVVSWARAPFDAIRNIFRQVSTYMGERPFHWSKKNWDEHKVSFLPTEGPFGMLLKLCLSRVELIHQPRNPEGIGETLFDWWCKGVGGAIKLLSAWRTDMDSFKNVLPSLPIPSVADTCRRYLESVRPLATDEEYAEQQRLVQEFLDGPASKLNTYLTLYGLPRKNWLEHLWELLAYTCNQDKPLYCSSNWFGLDAIKPRTILPAEGSNEADSQLGRAAYTIDGILEFKDAVDTRTLPPVKIRGVLPMDMTQYDRVFGGVRKPGRAPKPEETDRIATDKLQINRASDYCVVNYRGRMYQMPLYVTENDGKRRMTLEEIRGQLEALDKSATTPSRVHLLTMQDRKTWYQDRKELKQDNAEALRMVEGALFVLNLPDNAPESLEDKSRYALLGSDPRWPDKLNLFVDAAGGFYAHVEHSFTDATHQAHMQDSAIKKEAAQDLGIDPTCVTLQDPSPVAVDATFQPKEVTWNIPENLSEKFDGIKTAIDNTNADYDFCNVDFTEFGGREIKSWGVMGPDSFVQMAMQLAHRRMLGYDSLTYESTSLRAFARGRTETGRSVTNESKAWVDAMERENIPDEDKRVLLVAATNRHAHGYKQAMTGKGIDRHFLGLRAMAAAKEVDVPLFKDNRFLDGWGVTSSQTPVPPAVGGGFSPPDKGLGVSYGIKNNKIYAHVTAKHSWRADAAKEYGEHLRQAFRDIRALMQA